jgi:4-amino-4-deoxy-L-arabinose transferase-like glycosyltransferase
MGSTIGVSPDNRVLDRKASKVSFAYWLLIGTFVFAGLTGHDPWKADEAYVFGVIQHRVQSSDWMVPPLAGEPFMEKPPLFYWEF